MNIGRAISISCFSCGAPLPISGAGRYSCCEWCGREHKLLQSKVEHSVRKEKKRLHPLTTFLITIVTVITIVCGGVYLLLILKKRKEEEQKRLGLSVN